MRSMLLAAASAALLAGCGIGGPDYPQFGETAYRIEGLTTPADGAAATRTVIYRDGPKMRVEAVLPSLGAATIVFDEALTNSPALTRYLPPTQPGHFFQTRGGSLGVGIPGAIGARLARPDKTVIGVTGDGGAMYTIQALWTAARHKVDAKFIVCNNRSYRLLQLNIQQYWDQNLIAGREFPLSFDLSQPDIRFAELSQSLGVPAVRVARPEQIEPAIRQALDQKGPFLIDVVLEGDVHPEMIGVRCGQ